MPKLARLLHANHAWNTNKLTRNAFNIWHPYTLTFIYVYIHIWQTDTMTAMNTNADKKWCERPKQS